jgi:hypothetical protein
MEKSGIAWVVPGELVIAGVSVEITIGKNKVNQIF